MKCIGWASTRFCQRGPSVGEGLQPRGGAERVAQAHGGRAAPHPRGDPQELLVVVARAQLPLRRGGDRRLQRARVGGARRVGQAADDARRRAEVLRLAAVRRLARVRQVGRDLGIAVVGRRVAQGLLRDDVDGADDQQVVRPQPLEQRVDGHLVLLGVARLGDRGAPRPCIASASREVDQPRLRPRRLSASSSGFSVARTSNPAPYLRRSAAPLVTSSLSSSAMGPNLTGVGQECNADAGGGTRTPTACGHEDLNLARLPVPPRPLAPSGARMAPRL